MPALVRWLDAVNLETLEKLVLRSPALQRFVLERHRRAFCALMPQMPPIRRVAVVGGGLFPRTALILQEVLPSAKIVIIESNAENLAIARTLIGNVEFVNQRYVSGEFVDCDLLVIPLAFQGDCAAVYKDPPSRAVLIHDWMWRRRWNGDRCLDSIAQTAESGVAMRAASLLLIFILAKVAVLSGHALSPSFWTPIAYLWQDVLVALVFALIEFIIKRRSAWLYWTLQSTPL